MTTRLLQSVRRYLVLIIAVIVHVASVSGLLYAHHAVASKSTPVNISAPVAIPPPSVSGIPTEVKIPSVHIDLAVRPGVYDQSTDTWSLSGNSAHFATMTQPANNAGGNTFIYGHNNRHVFGPLKSLAVGAKAEVVTDVGSVFSYTLEGTKVVDPSDVSLFTYAGSPILTIQTCTGLWHEQRQLYTFRFEGVKESARSVAQRTEAQRQQLMQSIAVLADQKPETYAPRIYSAEKVEVASSTSNSQPVNTNKTNDWSNIIQLSSVALATQPLFMQLL